MRRIPYAREFCTAPYESAKRLAKASHRDTAAERTRVEMRLIVIS
jgi:hypothetical protein